METPKLFLIKTPKLCTSAPKTKFRSLITLSAPFCSPSPRFPPTPRTTTAAAANITRPPPTAQVSVAVIKDTNGKPIENAAVVFHLSGEEGKGNMEMKTNEEGKAIIDVIPIGDTMRLQIIADGFQTFGQDYKIDTDTKDITVRLKRPQQQYSTYAPCNRLREARSGSQAERAKTKYYANAPKAVIFPNRSEAADDSIAQIGLVFLAAFILLSHNSARAQSPAPSPNPTPSSAANSPRSTPAVNFKDADSILSVAVPRTLKNRRESMAYTYAVDYRNRNLTSARQAAHRLRGEV